MDGSIPGKDKHYRRGLLLIIIGYLISLMPYWWIFGTPLIYIIGVVLIWLSKKDRISKVLFTIVPIIFWLPGFWLFVYLWAGHATPGTFLIPQNFSGQITLYYGEPCGQELKKVDGRYIYRLPANGVMIIKNPMESGIIDEEFYFTDVSGKRLSKIDLLDQQEINERGGSAKGLPDTLRKKVGAFLIGTGASGTVNGVDTDHYKFDKLFIGSFDSLGTNNSLRLDSISRSVLKNCRAVKIK